jgi:hypothetical protein
MLKVAATVALATVANAEKDRAGPAGFGTKPHVCLKTKPPSQLTISVRRGTQAAGSPLRRARLTYPFPCAHRSSTSSSMT